MPTKDPECPTWEWHTILVYVSCFITFAAAWLEYPIHLVLGIGGMCSAVVGTWALLDVIVWRRTRHERC